MAYAEQNKGQNDKNLEERRRKLLHILESDAENEKNLLEVYTERSKGKSAMLIRSTALKQARDLEKAKIAERLLAEHFRKNNPDLREMVRVAGQNELVDGWREQLNERSELKQSETMNQIVNEEIESETKKRDEKQAELVELQRLQAKEKHLEHLRQQLDELNSREKEANKLVEKEKALIKQLAQIDQLEKERRKIEEKCQRELYGRALLHQHQTALRKRSEFIQSELKADLNWLNQLAEQENLDHENAMEKKRTERDNVLAMQELIECELKKEKIKELELNELQAYEASRIWAKREEEWRNETAARQKLLQEVIEDRRKQVAEQLAQNQQLQREELASREALLEKIENDNLNDKLEVSRRHEQAVEHNKELNNQLSEKIKADQLRENEIKADLEAQEKAEQAYEEMLRQEAENLRIKEKQLKNLTYYRSSQPYLNNSSRNIYGR
ncbi:unnamed protein product [Trichobilharzia szidati]|nr:unnamed protein product [Trichobilharzia szidati]